MGDRMSLYGLSNLLRPQLIIAMPLAVNVGAMAILLHGLAIFCLEGRLPRQAKSPAEVSDVQDPLLSKLVAHGRPDPPKDSPGVGYGSLTALRRRQFTVEENLQRPRLLVGILTVQKDGVLGGVFRGGIDVTIDLRPW